MEVPIHQDNYYWNLDNSKGLTVWIALDKCTKKNGALFYFKKSQSIGLLKHKASYAPGTSQVLKDKKILKNFKKITPKLNIGDVLIHHCLIIHGSQKNRSNRDRAGLTMRYIGKSSRIDNSAKKKYEKICRICYEDNEDVSKLLSPCACSGSMEYIHKHCLIKWIEIYGHGLSNLGTKTNFQEKC